MGHIFSQPDDHVKHTRSLDLSSPIITLTVGSERSRQNFSVHRSILVSSSVFRAMCDGRFREGCDRHIELPDDDPLLFRMMANWLYSGQLFYCAERGDQQLGEYVKAGIYAYRDLYIMADKYDWSELKNRIISKLSMLLIDSLDAGTESTGLTAHDVKELFFDVALSIYSSLGHVDSQFQTFYKEKGAQTGWCFDSQAGMPKSLCACLEHGGQLAVDTYLMMQEARDAMYVKVQSEIVCQFVRESNLGVRGERRVAPGYDGPQAAAAIAKEVFTVVGWECPAVGQDWSFRNMTKSSIGGQ